VKGSGRGLNSGIPLESTWRELKQITKHFS